MAIVHVEQVIASLVDRADSKGTYQMETFNGVTIVVDPGMSRQQVLEEFQETMRSKLEAERYSLVSPSSPHYRRSWRTDGH